MTIESTLVAQFKSKDGEACGPTLALPQSASAKELGVLLNNLLNNVIYFHVFVK
jgi:hypothetical protein